MIEMTYEMMNPEEMKTCVDLAAKAFENYDFFSAYVPDNRKRPAFLKNMLLTEFKVNLEKVYFLVAKQDGKIAAAAILRAPEYEMPTVKEYLKAGFWKNLVIGGYRNTAAWFAMDQEAGIPCRNLSGRTWFLHLLAVDNAIEGRGIGSGMLQECIIPFVREHGAEALSLYTNSEINRRFYTKNGFTEFDSKTFSYNGKSFGSWSYRMDLTEEKG